MMTVPWIVLTLPMSTSRNCAKPTYTFLAGRKSAGISANSATSVQRQNNLRHRQSGYFFQRRVLYSMTVHMETVYATTKIHFSTFPGARHGAMDSSDASNVHHGTGRATTYTFFVGIIQKEHGNSTMQCTTSRFPDSPIFRSTTCLYFHDCAWKRSTPPTRMKVRRFLDSARRCHG
jgi:hypothetical protein